MTDTAQGDEIEGLLLGMAKAHALGSSFFDAESVSTCERAAAEIASLRERLEKAEEKSSAWHRLALDVGVERDEARDLALAAESKLAEAKGVLALWRDSHLMTEDGAPVDPRQLNSYGGDVVMAASATRATLFHLETQETRHDG